MVVLSIIIGIAIGISCILAGIISAELTIKAHKRYVRKKAMLKYQENYKINKKIYQDYVARKKENE